MSTYSVRNLTGGYAPTGTAMMLDTLPAEWQNTEGPYGIKAVLSAWSGGYGDALGKRLFVHGGGDGDSASNALLVYSFAGDANPAGWTLAANSLSEIASVPTGTYAYLYDDDKPSAVHTYGGLFYDPTTDRFFTVGGSKFNNGPSGGSATAAGVYYDFAHSRWSSDSANGGTGAAFCSLPQDSLGACLLAKPDGTQLLYVAPASLPYFIDAATGAVTVCNTTSEIPWGTEEVNPCWAYDPTNQRYVLFGMGSATATTVTVNWVAKSITTASVSLTGSDAADLAADGPSVIYDAAHAQFIVFGMNDSLATQVTSIYEVDASSFAVTKRALTGDSIAWLGGSQGSYNRHIWFPEARIIGTVHKHDAPMSLIQV